MFSGNAEGSELMLTGKIRDWISKYGKYLFGFIIFPNGSSATVTVTPIPTLTYTSQYFTPFNSASWDFSNMAPIAISVVGDFFAQPVGNQIFEGFVMFNIIGLIFVRQDDVAIPLFLLWSLSAVLFGMNIIPAAWVLFLIAIQFVAFGGIVYTLYRGRRNS